MGIQFTQYHLPNGRKTFFTVDRSEEIEKKAKELNEKGYIFEAEILTTGQVSFECLKRPIDNDVETLSCEICENGLEAVLEAIDKLVNTALIGVQHDRA